MTERTNFAAAPTMQRALQEAFGDRRVEQAEHDLLYGDPDDWQQGLARFEDDDVWGNS